ncbi:MAG: ATP-binding protein [Synechococcus sp. SB0676_bin_10]|uniref:ATP-binding protein n=1 Tax=Synechococcus sp. SB0676_bin_10 TaxID=2604869 RepID=A0A6B1F484_9SYNE|nr:ATP-binding protein [Synechococcus sp. SB0676_bin_10]
MAAGERSVLRLSLEIAQLRAALVLIDEAETGLHPWVQKLLMLQLQLLALRNNLQIIVTSHSPVVLNSVSARGRIFLKRGDGGVTIQEPFRDIVQNALYGQSEELLNILCEDEVTEGVLQGVFDVIRPELGMGSDSDAVRVGRDTGAQQFPQYAEAFKTFGQIRNFVFVLDGDQENTSTAQKVQDKAGPGAPVLFLPGQHAPEVGVWEQIRKRSREITHWLGDHPESLQTRMANLDSVYNAASDTPSEIAKVKLQDLAQSYNRIPAELGRAVARVEAELPGSRIQPLVNGLRDAVGRWRSV